MKTSNKTITALLLTGIILLAISCAKKDVTGDEQDNPGPGITFTTAKAIGSCIYMAIYVDEADRQMYG